MTYLVKSVECFSHQGFKSVDVENHYNEDRVYAGKNTFAVIDGATSMVQHCMDGINPSAYTSNFLFNYFTKVDGDNASADDILMSAHSAFRNDIKENWPLVFKDGNLGPSAAVAVVKMHNDDTISMAHLADCSVIGKVNNKYEVLSKASKIHRENDNYIHRYISKKITEGMTHNEIKSSPQLKEMHLNNRRKSNIDYGMFNVDKETVNFIYACKFKKNKYEKIFIFSDGMDSMQGDNHSQSLIDSTIGMDEMGLIHYYEYLKSEYDSDPSFQKYMRGKHMDDASAIIITL